METSEPDQVRPKKINVPTQYRQGAKILKQMVEEGKSLKNLVYNNQHLVRCFKICLVRHVSIKNFSFRESVACQS